MADQNFDPEMLTEMRSLLTQAASHMRGLNYVQARIDAYSITARNRMDGVAECLKKFVTLCRGQSGDAGLQLDAIREIKPAQAAVVYDLKWKKKGRLSFEIYINGDESRPVVLTRQEWEFLKFLASSPPDPRDGFASTRSLDELVAYLGQGKSKTTKPKTYVNHMVSRIREALDKQKLDPDLVKRDDQLGVRFPFRGNL